MHSHEPHSYAVRVKSGEFVHFVVQQKNVDVELTLLGPDGQHVAVNDTIMGRFGPETMSAIATAAGEYRLVIEDRYEPNADGHYEVQLADLRKPTAADRDRVSAERTFMEGVELSYNAGADSQKAAVQKWQQSAALWHSLKDSYAEGQSLLRIAGIQRDAGDRQAALQNYNQALALMRAARDDDGIAESLNWIGVVEKQLDQLQSALDSYQAALTSYKAAGDLQGQGTALNNIASAYSSLGDRRKALEYYTQALPVRRAAGDSYGEALEFNNIGNAYDLLGQSQKALESYSQALALFEQRADRSGQALTLNNIGSLYHEIGENQKALEYFNRSLPLRRAEGDQKAIAVALNNIAIVYADMGDLQKALDYYTESLPAARQAGDHPGEAGTLSNLGIIYFQIGQTQKALDYYNQALQLERSIGFIGGVAKTLNNIGMVYQASGDFTKALDAFTQALQIERQISEPAGEAMVLNNIGGCYVYLRQNDKALDYFKQTLALQRSVNNRAGEATALTNLGEFLLLTGQLDPALDYFTQALPLFRSTQNPLGEAEVEMGLMMYWTRQGNRPLAIFFGKQAIDQYQALRRNIQKFGKEAQQSFVATKEPFYRVLAYVMIQEGRFPEAQQILDLLKFEQYSQFAQRRGAAESAVSPVPLTGTEEASKTAGDQIEAQVTALGREWSDLHSKSSRSPAEEARYSALSDQLTAANRRMQDYLKGLYDSFGKGDQANKTVEQARQSMSGMQDLARDMEPGTVALYTLVMDDKCVIIVITPSTRVAREIPITRIALRTKVFAFVGALASHASEADLLPKAQDLYKILVAPVQQDLDGAHAATLLWSLDDVLRYVPLAALHDGRQYLVERYRNAVITTAGLGNLRDRPQIASWQGLAMGVSKNYDGLGALTAVPEELDSVVHSPAVVGSHGPLAGTIMLDDSFTAKNMEAALDQHPPLVHIASHFVFHAGDDTKSYLLLGGNEVGGKGYHLSLADLRDDERIDFHGVELLTVAGCQTAVGSNDSDGREVDGLGIVAQSKGAKAVVATLWPVDDASVGALMAGFYKLWATSPSMSKSEALRQAQLNLLHSAGASGSYSNPYYWAPFVLIGNWK